MDMIATSPAANASAAQAAADCDPAAARTGPALHPEHHACHASVVMAMLESGGGYTVGGQIGRGTEVDLNPSLPSTVAGRLMIEKPLKHRRFRPVLKSYAVV